MRKIIAIVIAVISFSCFSFAQEEYLVLSFGCPGVQKKFTKVNVIDARKGHKMLGFVRTGLFDKFNLVVFNGNLPVSLAKFFRTKDSLHKEEKELVVILNDLYLSEKSEISADVSRLKISMRFFTKVAPDSYQEICSVDSIYKKSGFDVTSKLLKSVSQQLCEISNQVSNAVSNEIGDSSTYDLEELHQLDSLEKLMLPAYISNHMNAGIYANYTQFKMNRPDTATITIDDTDLKKIKVFKWNSKKNKNEKIDNKSVYAISDGNTILKSTHIGFYKMEKKNMDWYFDGQTSFTYLKDADFFWTFAFGVTGALVSYALDKDDRIFRFKINYLKGNSIPITLLN